LLTQFSHINRTGGSNRGLFLTRVMFHILRCSLDQVAICGILILPLIWCFMLFWYSSGVNCPHKLGKNFWGLTSNPFLSKLVKICTAPGAMDCFLTDFCRLLCMGNLCSKGWLLNFLATHSEVWKSKILVDQALQKGAKMKFKIQLAFLGEVWPQPVRAH